MDPLHFVRLFEWSGTGWRRACAAAGCSWATAAGTWPASAPMPCGEVSVLSPFDALPGSAGPVHENVGSRWAPGGVGLRKLDAGWRPGSGPRPVPPVETFERQRPR